MKTRLPILFGLVLLACLGVAVGTFSHTLMRTAESDDILRIQVGNYPSDYSDAHLRKRVHELERAVRQLQYRVYELESSPPVVVKPAPKPDTWLCQVTAMGNLYTGTGPTEAVATDRVVKACRKGESNDSFFCKKVECKQ